MHCTDFMLVSFPLPNTLIKIYRILFFSKTNIEIIVPAQYSYLYPPISNIYNPRPQHPPPTSTSLSLSLHTHSLSLNSQWRSWSDGCLAWRIRRSTRSSDPTHGRRRPSSTESRAVREPDPASHRRVTYRCTWAKRWNGSWWAQTSWTTRSSWRCSTDRLKSTVTSRKACFAYRATSSFSNGCSKRCELEMNRFEIFSTPCRGINVSLASPQTPFFFLVLKWDWSSRWS